jgi:hypothetical protein
MRRGCAPTGACSWEMQSLAGGKLTKSVRDLCAALAGVVLHAFREIPGHIYTGSAIRQSAVDVTGQVDADAHLDARGLGNRQLLTADPAFVRPHASSRDSAEGA